MNFSLYEQVMEDGISIFDFYEFAESRSLDTTKMTQITNGIRTLARFFVRNYRQWEVTAPEGSRWIEDKTGRTTKLQWQFNGLQREATAQELGRLIAVPKEIHGLQFNQIREET